MPKCDQCGTEAILPFNCAYCGKHYCVEHRIPESHQCSNAPKTPPPYLAPIITTDAGQKGKTKPTQEQRPKAKNREDSHTNRSSPNILGLCPQCGRISDNILNYDATTITFQCVHCGFKFIQLKAPSHDYVEQPEKPEPVEKPTPIEPIIKQKHFPLKKVITLSIIALIVGVLVWSSPQFLSNNPATNPSTTPSVPSTTPNTPASPDAAPSITVPKVYSRGELVAYALSLINTDRQSKGLQNVTLSNIDSGQRHADAMLANSFFSHWDTNGYKPYMRYTLAGGRGSVSENVAWTWIYVASIDAKEEIKDHEYSMMYDDAEWDWGHRDNILDPLHTKVSIGIAYDNNNLYFVQDFEDDYISWSALSLSSQVRMQGTILKSGESISQVGIYFDNPAPLTNWQLENSPYNGSYDQGTYVGLAVSSEWEATEGITITATTWSQAGSDFAIAFDLSPAFVKYGKGVYTLYLWTDSNNCLTTLSVWN